MIHFNATLRSTTEHLSASELTPNIWFVQFALIVSITCSVSIGLGDLSQNQHSLYFGNAILGRACP